MEKIYEIIDLLTSLNNLAVSTENQEIKDVSDQTILRLYGQHFELVEEGIIRDFINNNEQVPEVNAIIESLRSELEEKERQIAELNEKIELLYEQLEYLGTTKSPEALPEEPEK